MDFEIYAQYITDKLYPYIYQRWTFTGAIAMTYLIRIIRKQSHAVITYCVGIYLLHSFILFVTPKDENIPDPFENIEEEEYNPRNIDNEFMPYIRKMPEFNFWLTCTQIVSVSLFLIHFDFTDIPAFTPILVLYFIFVLGMTFYKLWIHSKKYKYYWFSVDKSTLKN